MRKIIVLLIIFMSLMPLSAKFETYTSFGPEFVVLDLSTYLDGNTYVSNERSAFLSLTTEGAFMGEKGKGGLLLSLSVAAPVSCTVDGYSVPTSFADSLTSIGIGFIAKRPLSTLLYHVSAGYEFTFRSDSEYLDGVHVTQNLNIHSLSAKTGFTKNTEEEVAFDFGLECSLPLVYNVTLSAMGETLDMNARASGIFIKPYIGLIWAK